MNEETRYLIHMLVGIDFMISKTQRFIERYPDDRALQFSLLTCRQFRQYLLDRLDRARLMDDYLDEVQR